MKAKVSEFISDSKKWNLNPITNHLPTDIINKIKGILVPVNDIQDKCYLNIPPQATCQIRQQLGLTILVSLCILELSLLRIYGT